jgi:hypothetical protein
MRRRAAPINLKPMFRTYAVSWQEESGPIHHGKLELRADSLVLEGSDGASPQLREIAYPDVGAVHAAETASDRLFGRRTLVIAHVAGTSLKIAAVAQPGFVSEVTESLLALRARARGA